MSKKTPEPDLTPLGEGRILEVSLVEEGTGNTGHVTGLGRAQDLLARAALAQSAIDAITESTPEPTPLDDLAVTALRAVLANETAMRDHHYRLSQIHADTATTYEERMLRVSEEIARRLGETNG